MRHRRRERGVLSTRQLMGIEQITDCYIQTAHGDLIFFIIQPTNISVLPQAGIEARILSLLNVLRSQQEVELLAMNSRESFENNKAFYQARMEQETSPKIRELLEKDRAHLDEIQVLSTLAREFYLVLRLTGKKERSVLPYLSRIEKSIQDSGFTVRVANKEDLKRMLAVYYAQDVTTEHFQDFDGQQWAGEGMENAQEEKADA